MWRFCESLARTLVTCLRFGAFSAAALVVSLTFTDPVMARYAAIVIDADSGIVLHEENANTRNYPASLTKMMTLYLAFEAVERGQLSINQKLKVSRRAAGQAPSKLGLSAGSTIVLSDALDALIVRSANDVATVVAEAIGGTEIKFAQLMTKRARELGMSRTTFRNASGLPNRGQLSTARDMMILARALQRDFPQHYKRFSQSRFSYGGRTYRNHNKLLASYDGADGIKTGYTRASGYNLVASARRDGRRLIGVVFGGKSGKWRNRHMTSLLNRGFKKAARLGGSTVAARPIPKPVSAGMPVAKFAKPAAPVEVSAPIGEGAWGIQVGAFIKFAQAQSAVEQAASQVTGLIRAAVVDIQVVVAKGRTLYRARLTGMSQERARESCGKLHAVGQECALVTPAGTMRMASLIVQ